MENNNSSAQPHWTSVFENQYLVMQTLFALEDIGFLRLARQHKLSIHEYAARLNVREDLLKDCLEYLWSISDILNYDNDLYWLKDSSLPESILMYRAYKPVFDHLAPLLLEKKQYGKDVIRDGYYCQYGCTSVSHDVTQKIMLALARGKPGQLIDLGCGSGQSLVEYCAGHNDRFGLGIENNHVIAELAKHKIRSSNLDKRISIKEFDLLDIDSWKSYVINSIPKYFFASTVLHELLKNDKKVLEQFLKKIHDEFPGSRFLIAEFDGITFAEIRSEQDRSKKLLAAATRFWHPFTEQGMPQPKEFWLKILKKTGWNVQGVYSSQYYILLYDCSAQ